MTEDNIRKEIIEKLEQNVFVEAGAGAGKTTLIVSRIMNQLKNGMSPKKIVVITFTNAAAEELRSRIIKKVREESRSEKLTDKERKFLEEALKQMDLMNISTIHSFCLKLLKERIFDAKLPMDIRLLEETATAKQHKDFFTEWIGKLDTKDWKVLKNCMTQWKWKQSTVLEIIEQFFMQMCELPDNTNIYQPTLTKIVTKDEYYTKLLYYAIKARKEYQNSRQIRNVTNDDLLQKTHRLICKSEEARKYFAKRIGCIYVDEFQDTDHIQEEFIWKLAADENDSAKLRDGALFLVGDPKQSIYRFRGAQPEVYFKAKQKMGALSNAGVYHLNYNFRSNEKIIQWVNDSFASRQITSNQPYSPMIAKKVLPSGCDQKTLAGVYYYKNPEKKSTDYTEDAAALATLIRELVGKPYQIVDEQNGTMSERPVRYSDILILCYKKDKMDEYLKVMSTCEIPVQIDGSIKLENNQVLRCYARIYDCLTHAYDHAKKIGALEALKENGCADEYASLNELLKKTAEMSDYGVAEYLLRRLDVLLPRDMEISKVQMISAQTKLQQMFESVLIAEEVNGSGIAEAFWRYCDAVVDRELSLEEGADAVRFMNLHKAKGLEGNIVILTKRDEQMQFGLGSFRKGSDFYPACRNRRGRWSVYANYPGIPAILQDAQQQEAEEQTRLQYVAATRAKQVLIVMDAIKDHCMFIDYPLKNTPGVESVESIIQNAKAFSKEETTADTYSYEENLLEKQEPSWHSLSPSGLEKKRSDIRASVREKMTDEQKEAYRPQMRPTGNIAGNVMHRSLELFINRWAIDFERAPKTLEKMMSICVKQAILENKKDIEKEREELYQTFMVRMLSIFAEWTYQKKLFRQAKNVYTELDFSYFKEQMEFADKCLPTWMNGTADLIVENQDGSFWVLDYKSDYAPYLTTEDYEASLREKYEGQLFEYRYAVGRLFDVEEKNVHLGIISFEGEEKLVLRCTVI